LSAGPRASARPLHLVVFPGPFNWPVWVATNKGWFAEEGLALRVTHTPGSAFQLAGLIRGEFDVAVTLVDNVIAYREGQGEVPVVGEDLVALMAADTRAMPTLVTAPEVQSYEALRGKTLSVDAKTTGYALVLRAMLDRGGLDSDDYELESVGGVLQRFEALVARRHAGALFNSPFEGLLRARGFNMLDTAGAVLGRYQGQVVSARKGWAYANRETVVGFLRGFQRGLQWLYQPAHREEAFAIYGENTPNATTEAAATAYSILFHPVTGFALDGALDPEGLAKVIELRARYGQPARPLGDVSDYYDPTFLRAARE
jgi:ABC-type nitrate/sulfonate/bicarbonate transport system substrate-binding protein